MKRTARESLFERLVLTARGEPGPFGCYVWTGSRCNKGYGQIKTAGRSKRVHIAAWELVKGRRVRAGYTLDHVCRNVACWRPSHMQEVTRAVNTARGNRANPRSTAEARAAKAAQAFAARNSLVAHPTATERAARRARRGGIEVLGFTPRLLSDAVKSVAIAADTAIKDTVRAQHRAAAARLGLDYPVVVGGLTDCDGPDP